MAPVLEPQAVADAFRIQEQACLALGEPSKSGGIVDIRGHDRPDTRASIFAACADLSAARMKGNRAYEGRMFQPIGDRGAVGRFPDSNSAFAIRGREHRTVMAEAQRRCATVEPDRRPDRAPRHCIPHTHRMVIAAGDQEATFWAELYDSDWGRASGDH
jgi:hypothetical protein